DARAVARRRPLPGGRVLRRVVPAQDRLGLDDDTLASVELVVDVGRRRDQRRVAVPQRPGLVLGVAADSGGIDRFGEPDLVHVAVLGPHDRDAIQAVGALAQYEVVGERIDRVELDVVAVGNEWGPVLALGIDARRRNQLEVARLAALV